MNILFFTKGDKSVGSSRYRVWLVAEWLEKQYGWTHKITHSMAYSLFSLRPARFRLFFSIFSEIRNRKHNILFVHKSLFPWDIVFLIIAAKKFFGKKLVYDLDDAEWIHSAKKSSMLARHADVVFCGSHEILQWAQQLNNNCVLIPTTVDAILYGKYAVQYNEQSPFIIGWVGQGRAHYKAGNFTIVKPVLDVLYAGGSRFCFVVIGAQRYQPLKDFFLNTPYEVIFVDDVDWSNYEAVPELIRTWGFQVGIMPLMDTLFNRAKCALKAIEYMACGVPIIVSPVGEANVIIKNGTNGFLADSPEEWLKTFLLLARDINLRKTIGKAGQKVIQEHYSLQNIIPRIKAEIVKLYK
jgi:glycosyltransferase involved in cell wall biosynthesis